LIIVLLEKLAETGNALKNASAVPVPVAMAAIIKMMRPFVKVLFKPNTAVLGARLAELMSAKGPVLNLDIVPATALLAAANGEAGKTGALGK